MKADDTAAVVIENVAKTYRSAKSQVRALDGFNLSIARGEVVALLGASGCGKTTSLRCVAGLEQPDQGRIFIGDKLVFSDQDRVNLPPEKRHLGMVFQSYALWPHMTIGENLAYPLSNSSLSRVEIAARVREALDTVACGHLVDRLPSELSGGQQQRAALARALAYQPRLLLFDEPLSNLDAKLREKMRVELSMLQNRLGFAAIYVTHDQTEAMTLAHKVVLMHDGKILQAGTPREVYERPATAYVASFVGTVNFAEGVCATGGAVNMPFGSIQLRQRSQLTGPVLLGIRPEHLAISRVASQERDNFSGRIIAVSYLGSAISYLVEMAPGVEWSVSGPAALEFPVGEVVNIRADATRWLVFPPRSELETSAQPNQD